MVLIILFIIVLSGFALAVWLGNAACKRFVRHSKIQSDDDGTPVS